MSARDIYGNSSAFHDLVRFYPHRLSSFKELGQAARLFEVLDLVNSGQLAEVACGTG